MHPSPSAAPIDPARLSALHDGEADDAALTECLAQWSQDDALRDRWHRYQLVGDVLRAADLGRGAAADAAFLATLRQRLADEPAIQPTDALLAAGPATTGLGRGAAAPTPTPTPAAAGAAAGASPLHGVVDLDAARVRWRPRTRRWAMPAGIAAGVALVAGLVALNRQPADGDDNVALVGGREVGVRLLDRNGQRDARFDSYLAAHRQFQPANALGPSPGLMRSAVYETGPER
jgi:sigma-E factor negative regulatory protein RseA